MKTKKEIRWVKLSPNGAVTVCGEPTVGELLTLAQNKLKNPMTRALASLEIKNFGMHNFDQIHQLTA